MLRFKLVLIAFISTFTALSAYAGSATSSADSVKYEFKPIVVTGQRYEIPKKNVASSISIVSSAQIRETNFTNVADAVSYMTPGVFTTRRANIGYGVAAMAGGSMTIRGIGGKPNSQVLVLIDGRPDFQGIFSHPINDAYFMDNVERIEIIRGPASAVYGTNALGGVVNIISKSIKKRGFGTNLDVDYGSYNTQKYRLQHSGNVRKFQYLLSAGYSASNTHRDNASFESQNFALKMGYQVNNNYSVQFNGSFTPYTFRDPGPQGISLNGYFENGDIERSSMDLTLSNKFDRTDGTVKLHGNFGVHTLSDGWHSEDQTNGIIAFQNFELPGDMKSTIGFDVKRYGGTAKSNGIKLGTYFNDEQAAYLHLQKIVLKKLILASGVRLEHSSAFGSEWIPKFGLVYHWSDQSSLRANMSKGFRTPSVKDLYLFPPANQDLEPERLWNYELGLNQSFGDFIALDLCGYYYEGEQLIQTTMVAPGQMLNQNIGSNVARGVELAVHIFPTSNLSAYISYSYINADQTIPFSPDKLNFLISYSLNKMDLSFYGEFIQKLYASYQLAQMPPATTLEKLSDYAVLHFKFQYSLLKNMRFTINVENVADQDYEILKGYPMPGRTFSTGVNYSF